MPDTVAWRNGLTEQQWDEDTSHKGSLSQTSSVPGKPGCRLLWLEGHVSVKTSSKQPLLIADELYHPHTNFWIDNLMAGCVRFISRVPTKMWKSCHFHSKTNSALFHINRLITTHLTYSWFFLIFTRWGQCLLLILLLTKTNVSSQRYEGLLMWCLSFVLRNNSSCSSGASQCCGSLKHRQEGKAIHSVQRLPIPFRMIRSVSQRAPPRARGQGPCQSDGTQQRPMSLSATVDDC